MQIKENIKEFDGEKDCYFQRDGAPSLYHTDVRAYVNYNLPNKMKHMFLWERIKDN